MVIEFVKKKKTHEIIEKWSLHSDSIKFVYIDCLSTKRQLFVEPYAQAIQKQALWICCLYFNQAQRIKTDAENLQQ